MFDVWFDALLPLNSSTGGEIDSLILTIYGVTGFFFVVMESYLIYLLIRYRRSSGSGAYSPGATLGEVGWILALAVIVLGLDLAIDHKGGSAWRKIKEGVPNPEITVKVLGQQFLWNFVYPGKDGLIDTEDDLVSAMELHVPVNAKVKLLLRSKDVIHSLFLPAARFKQDVLPGRQIPAWVEITQKGETPIICAELCGSAHSAMSGTLFAHDPKEFKTWLADLAKNQ